MGPQSHLHVLLVDDNDENRLIIRTFLKSFSCQIDEAKNGLDALSMFQEGAYDLILMDMQMPLMDGYTATKDIRFIEKERHLPATPILALTAYALKEESERSITAGCNGHLSKPISKAALLEAIHKFTSPIPVTVDEDLKDVVPDYLFKRNSELKRLRELLAREEFNEMEQLGHKLRGSAGSYGFKGLSVIGEGIEKCSNARDSYGIKRLLDEYDFYLRNLKLQ